MALEVGTRLRDTARMGRVMPGDPQRSVPPDEHRLLSETAYWVHFLHPIVRRKHLPSNGDFRWIKQGDSRLSVQAKSKRGGILHHSICAFGLFACPEPSQLHCAFLHPVNIREASIKDPVGSSQSTKHPTAISPGHDASCATGLPCSTRASKC